MKILVTGANGRIGRALRWSSLAVRHELIWVVRPGRDANSGNEIALDLAIPGEIEAQIATLRPDAIVHLAAVLGAASEQEAEAVNVALVGRIAEASVDAGVSLVLFASSAAVYGDRSGVALSEDAARRPTSAYGDAKLRAEQALAEAMIGAPTTTSIIMRIFNVYGAGFDGSLVNRLAGASPQNPVTLMGLDEFVRDYVHIDDVIRAISAIVERRPTMNVAVNVASGTPRSNRSLIAELSSARQIHYFVDSASWSRSVADISRARNLFGWEPRWTTTLGPTS